VGGSWRKIWRGLSDVDSRRLARGRARRPGSSWSRGRWPSDGADWAPATNKATRLFHGVWFGRRAVASMTFALIVTIVTEGRREDFDLTGVVVSARSSARHDRHARRRVDSAAVRRSSARGGLTRGSRQRARGPAPAPATTGTPRPRANGAPGGNTKRLCCGGRSCALWGENVTHGSARSSAPSRFAAGK